MADRLLNRLEDLLECAEALLEPVCRAFVAPGVPVPYDVCEKEGENDGMVWTAAMFITPDWPAPTGSTNPCTVYTATIEVGVTRCQTGTIRDDGNLPSVDAITTDTETVHRDRHALLQALQCCFTEDQYVLDLWEPIAEGGCVGGRFQLRIMVNRCHCEDHS